MSASVLVGGAPAALRASASRVDVWRFALEPPGGAMLNVLSEAEHALAARMRVGGARWSAARAALRRTLCRYAGLDPAALVFVTGPQGKPRLEGPGAALHFSLSHSREVGLLAVRLDHEVGADVEHVRDDVDGVAIAHSIFTPRERSMMAALTDAGSRDAFFRTWVRREAFAKASGRGVALCADHEVAGYTVRELAGIPGCVAAVASRGTGWTVAFA